MLFVCVYVVGGWFFFFCIRFYWVASRILLFLLWGFFYVLGDGVFTCGMLTDVFVIVGFLLGLFCFRYWGVGWWKVL